MWLLSAKHEPNRKATLLNIWWNLDGPWIGGQCYTNADFWCPDLEGYMSLVWEEAHRRFWEFRASCYKDIYLYNFYILDLKYYISKLHVYDIYLSLVSPKILCNFVFQSYHIFVNLTNISNFLELLLATFPIICSCFTNRIYSLFSLQFWTLPIVHATSTSYQPNQSGTLHLCFQACGSCSLRGHQKQQLSLWVAWGATEGFWAEEWHDKICFSKERAYLHWE